MTGILANRCSPAAEEVKPNDRREEGEKGQVDEEEEEEEESKIR